MSAVEVQSPPPAYHEIKKRLKDKAWRLDNLYWIRDERGNPIPFKRNAAQIAYCDAMHNRDLIPKARKLGFSTMIDLMIADSCIFRSHTVAGIVDETLKKSQEKLAIVKFAYDRLPETIRQAVPLIRANTEELEWGNGSRVSAGTSYRGNTPLMLHISEYGRVSVDKPDKAREIKTGSINSVPISGWIGLESTAHGTHGEFYEMVTKARALADQKTPLTALDFKLHFFGWWMKREYRLPSNLVIIPQELKEYFAEQKAKYGIVLDANQQAWYTKQHIDLGYDDVRQEFPTNIDELFLRSIEGAYFKRELTKARQEGRIGGMVPHDPSRQVNTFWDIGEDGTAVVFHQTDGVRHRFIDYFEEEGGSLQSAVNFVRERGYARGFNYGKHLGPHDLENKDWANSAKTRKAMAKELGLEFTIVPRVSDKEASIEAARRMIGMSWFDLEHCSRLVEALDNYCKRWNKALGMFTAEPVHNWASHPADAIQQGAMGLASERDRPAGRDKSAPRRGSFWAG